MEVQLSPEKQARLRNFAARTGRDPAELVVEAVDRGAPGRVAATRRSRQATRTRKKFGSAGGVAGLAGCLFGAQIGWTRQPPRAAAPPLTRRGRRESGRPLSPTSEVQPRGFPANSSG